MIKTTILNYDRESGRASSATGRRSLGELQPDELISLLERFRKVDSIENVEAEPEIMLETRLEKRTVTTGQGRLLVRTPGKMRDSTLVLTPAEIVAEMDGTAAIARKRAVREKSKETFAGPFIARQVPKPLAPRCTRRQIMLAATVLCLAGYLAFPRLYALAESSGSAFKPITDNKQLATCRDQVAGVYMTGSRPGHHGISLSVAGTMTLFQLNAQTERSIIRDRFSIGHIDRQLCVLGSLPGGAMRFIGKDTLLYGGETYRRTP